MSDTSEVYDKNVVPDTETLIRQMIDNRATNLVAQTRNIAAIGALSDMSPEFATLMVNELLLAASVFQRKEKKNATTDSSADRGAAERVSLPGSGGL